MSARLNIEVKKNNIVLANAYYHWGGNTYTALKLTKTILSKMKYVFEKYQSYDDLLKAVKLLESTQAGLDKVEKKHMKSLYSSINFRNYIDRNRGLISATKEGIERTAYWDEYRITIYLDEKIIDFDIFSFYSLIEWEYEIDNKNHSLLECLLFDPEVVKFEEFNEFEKQLSKLINQDNNAVKFIKKDNSFLIGEFIF